jgi:hypothetical protein
MTDIVDIADAVKGADAKMIRLGVVTALPGGNRIAVDDRSMRVIHNQNGYVVGDSVVYVSEGVTPFVLGKFMDQVQPAGWKVSGSGSLSGTAGAATFPAMTEIYDSHGYWPGGADAWVTIPAGKSGVYGVSIRGSLASIPTRFLLEMQHNFAAPFIRGSAGLINDGGANPVDADTNVAVGHTMYLEAGDTLVPRAFQRNPSNATVGFAAHFEGWLLFPCDL